MIRAPARMPWRARLQWAAGLAAAAALVGLLAVTLPRLGGGGTQVGGGGAMRAGEGAAGASGIPAATPTRQLLLEDQSNTDYDAASLQTLAQNTAAQADEALAAEPQAPTDLIPASAAQAAACVAQAAQPTGGDRLVRLIQAKYGGVPAYLGVYLEGPGAGQVPTKVTIWAVARQGCRILSFSSQRL